MAILVWVMRWTPHHRHRIVPDLMCFKRLSQNGVSIMNNNSVISVDIAKNIFQICHLNEHNKVTTNKKVSRNKLLTSILNLDSKQVVMEACYTSNFWGRLFERHGLTVKLIPPHQVKPFVIGNKNDHNDAVAIAEASRRPRAKFVAVKSLEHQDIQSLERIRERLIKNRTALTNQTRGLLAEYGITIKPSLKQLRSAIPLALEDANNQLTVISREFIQALFDELKDLDQRISDNEKSSAQQLESNDDYRRLQTIPGIGPVISRSIICAINHVQQFKDGREMSAWIGLTPKQHSSGDKSKMLGISRRGNQALRKHLIHGARSVVRWCEGKSDPLSLWLQKLLKTKHKNRVVVALANKLARVAWAILAKNESYKLNP